MSSPCAAVLGERLLKDCLCFARAALSAIGMLEFHKLNKQKQLQREKEGITKDQMDKFREMGDQSPLYR